MYTLVKIIVTGNVIMSTKAMLYIFKQQTRHEVSGAPPVSHFSVENPLLIPKIWRHPCTNYVLFQ